MGTISKKLQNCFRSRGRRPAPLKVGEMEQAIPEYEELLKKGYDPLHAAYVQTQNLTSIFAECVSQFRELEEYCEIVGEAEDEYMPGGPPISPLTMSYFTLWAFFDVRFGPDRETIGTCLFDLANGLGYDEFQEETVSNYQQSRMGIYEHAGRRKSRIRLKELLTGREVVCHSSSGYHGKKGELWYVRLAAPLSFLEDSVNYHVALTTPYVLKHADRNDWTDYLKRNLSETSDTAEALDEFLKFGPEPCYWHEFVFQGYLGAQYDAIFLTGIPDIKESLPHASFR